jgi:hypothetical protein
MDGNLEQGPHTGEEVKNERDICNRHNQYMGGIMKIRTQFILIAVAGGVLLATGAIVAITGYISTTLSSKDVVTGVGVVTVGIAIYLIKYAIDHIR